MVGTSIFDILRYSTVAFVMVFVVLLIVIMVIKFFLAFDRKLESMQSKSEKKKTQNIDDTTLVLISAAVAAVVRGRAHITRVRRLSSLARSGGAWAQAGRITLLGSHNINKRD